MERAGFIRPITDGEGMSHRTRPFQTVFVSRKVGEYGILNPENLQPHRVGPRDGFPAPQFSAMNDGALVCRFDPGFRASINVGPSDPQHYPAQFASSDVRHGAGREVGSGARIPAGQHRSDLRGGCGARPPVAIHRTAGGNHRTSGTAGTHRHTSVAYDSRDQLHLSSHGLVTEGVFVKFPCLKFVLVEAVS